MPDRGASSVAPPYYDPYDAAIDADPYPAWRRLRDEAPCYYNEEHGFYALSETVDLIYKVTDYYAPEWDRTLLWNDPQINIAWPLVDGQPPVLSAKDAQGRPFSQAEVFEE